MKNRIVDIVGNRLEEFNVFIFDAFQEVENGTTYLRIVLDSDKVIDVGLIVKITKIISPIIDDANIMEGNYILDIYAKSKESEQ